MTELNAKAVPWPEAAALALEAEGVRLAAYVPDNVLSPLIRTLEASDEIETFVAAREEEAVGIVTGAWLGGRLGVTLMQTSGFATLGNTLASLVLPYQIPLVMVVSERGTLGEFNPGQVTVCRLMRPMLDSLGIEHHTLSDADELEFVMRRAVRQAVSTQAPVAMILNPRLTAQRN